MSIHNVSNCGGVRTQMKITEKTYSKRVRVIFLNEFLIYKAKWKNEFYFCVFKRKLFKKKKIFFFEILKTIRIKEFWKHRNSYKLISNKKQEFF